MDQEAIESLKKRLDVKLFAKFAAFQDKSLLEIMKKTILRMLSTCKLQFFKKCLPPLCLKLWTDIENLAETVNF